MSDSKPDAQEIRDNLSQFTGSEHWYRFNAITPNVLLTDGAKYVAEACEAYWLMDVISSHIPDYFKKTNGYFALATLKKNTDDRGWTFTLDDGNDNVFCTQDIPFSDFPLPEGIKLYVEYDEKNWVILLPSEH